MHVEGAAADGGEERLRDPVAVRGPDQELRPQREDRGDLLFIEARRLADGETHGACGHLHRGLAQHPARCGAIGLRHHARDLNDAALAKTIERLERADCERRGAEEQSALC